MDVDIERDFLVGLREVKSLSDKDNLEKYKMYVLDIQCEIGYLKITYRFFIYA